MILDARRHVFVPLCRYSSRAWDSVSRPAKAYLPSTNVEVFDLDLDASLKALLEFGRM